jgi:hypothetical protein
MEYRLKIGEEAPLIKRWYASSYHLIYAGMLSDDVFSVVITFHMGHNSMAHNLYLNTGQKEVYYKKGVVNVVSVTPDELRIRVER